MSPGTNCVSLASHFARGIGLRNAYAFFSNINEQIHLCLTSPPFLLRNARNYGHGGGRGEQAYIDWLLRILSLS